ncbi:MAG: putative sugar nucleotidyl transferase [Planctomycetota bacterium]|nr:putative sugar nucleotidyl transferase [Planctomycetota bacterium]
MATHPTDRMIIFDDGLGQFGPMTDLRASFEIRSGMYTTAGRLAAHRPKTLAGYWVPRHLAPLVAERANAPVNTLPDEEVLYCASGRWAMPGAGAAPELGEALVEEPTGHVVAALLRRADAEYLLTTGQLHERIRIRRVPHRVLYRYPWDIIAYLKETIPHDISTVRLLDARLPGDRVSVMGQHPVEVHQTADVGPNVVFDAREGPIIVHEQAVIRPGCVLCGPCSIGAGSTVVDRALIKANTVIGPVCKVGGEIGATIFQGCANKSHDGHLGDSWVGKWVNLGAGTTNSNLLNTYGEVTMRTEPDGSRHRTGLTFLGAIIGDHVKTAINTSLMTGTCLGTGAMIARSTPPPATVRRFAWLTDDGERVFQFEKFLQTMKAMMARRDQKPSGEYLALVGDLHEGVAGARAPAG